MRQSDGIMEKQTRSLVCQIRMRVGYLRSFHPIAEVEKEGSLNCSS
jgi:hypothetical protein